MISKELFDQEDGCVTPTIPAHREQGWNQLGLKHGPFLLGLFLWILSLSHLLLCDSSFCL